MRRLPFSCLLGAITVLIMTSARAQTPDKAYFQKMYATTRQALVLEQQQKAKSLSALIKGSITDSADYDAVYYDLNFNITTTPRNVEGTVTGVFRSNLTGLSKVNLNFDSREGASAWKDFSVSGNVASWTHANGVLSVQLDHPYDEGESFSITVHYSGLPRVSGLLGLEYDTNGYGDVVISTLSEPYQAQTWWPCKDDPADKADSVRVSVTVPKDLIAASNGRLVSETDNLDNTKTYVWKENYPITTYLVSLAVSNYATFSDQFEYAPGQFMPIDYYVYPADLSTALVAFKPIANMLQIYSRLFGMYPFINEKYGQAVFQWGGAMEHQTLTSVGGVSTGWEYIYAHELSHQWFGDEVTCQNWGDIWLNEGFATYSEALYVEQLYGNAAYHDYMEASLGSIRNWAADPIFRYSIDDPWYIFRATVYDKGAWVLHMLRRVVGDSLFATILHDYPNDPAFKFKTATTEQFRDFCEQKSGRDLDWFFQQWIYEPYYPSYQWGYAIAPATAGYDIYLEIKQVQDQVSAQYDHLYKMPIDLRVNFADGSSQTLVTWDSLKVQTYNLPFGNIPSSVSFDPETWILKEARKVPVTGIHAGTEPIRRFQLLQNYPNPVQVAAQRGNLSNHPATIIRYELPKPALVELTIYNTLGEKVYSFKQEHKPAGSHEVTWDGRDQAGREVASGVYIYRLHANSASISRKMIVMR